MTRTRAAVFAATTALAFTAAACSTDEDHADQPEAIGSASVEEGTAPAEPAVLELGQTHTYDDGFALSIDVVETFVPREFGENEKYALLETTFTNGSATALQIDALFQGCTVDGVTDPDGYELFQGITSQWPNLIRGGGEAVWRSACLVGDGQELQVDMQVGAYAPIWWTGAVPQ